MIRVTIIATGFDLNNNLFENDNNINNAIKHNQTNLFEENNVEFIKRVDEPLEEVIHNIDDDYKEYEDNFDSISENIDINDKSDEVIIEELDSSESFDYQDSSNKKNEYLKKRNKRINHYNNKSFTEETYEQKLAIPAYKRKNINLDNEASDNDQTKTLDFTEED